MRFFFFIATLAATAPAAADAPDARASYVERRGMLELDAQCHLFTPNIHAALQATAAQARGALLRGGWSIAQVQNLEQTVVTAARQRGCQDPRTSASAANARRASATWINASAARFPGWTRAWYARRAPSPEGWRLSQAIDAPIAATFGVRLNGGREQLTLTFATPPGVQAPTSASLVMRDVTRSPATDIALPQRIAFGLRAGAPALQIATEFPALPPPTEQAANGALAVFVFPDAAFRNLLSLDPRESVEVHLRGPTRQVLLVDVGDVAVARAFLAIQ